MSVLILEGPKESIGFLGARVTIQADWSLLMWIVAM